MLKKILLSLLIVFAATSAAHAEDFNARKANLAEVSAVRIGYGSGTVRIVLDVSKKVSFTESSAENPSRIIIDLKNAWLNQNVQREFALKSLAAKKLRIAQFDASTVRIVIESMAGMKPFFLDGGPKGFRFVIDVGNANFKANPDLNKPDDDAKRELEAEKQRELELKQQKEREDKEKAELEAEKQRELELKQQKEREAKEKAELEAKEQREREIQQQKDRELQERERKLQERERLLKEKEERELKEREAKEREKKERELEERERKLKEREREIEKKIREQQEREAKAQAKREEKERREREKREKDKKSSKDAEKHDDDEKQVNEPFKELDKDLNTLTALTGKKIVIDPGHGGNDAGAIGPTGVMEKSVTLKVALELRRLLESEGAQVILTRETDKTVSIKGAQASDIEELGARVDVANRIKADIFISIHADSFTRPEARGTTGYYYSKSTSGRGQKLADAIRRNLVEQLGTPSRGTQPCNFYVVKHTDMPATLIELGFISNKDEEKLLDSAEGVKKAAQGILDGIEDYFG